MDTCTVCYIEQSIEYGVPRGSMAWARYSLTDKMHEHDLVYQESKLQA